MVVLVAGVELAPKLNGDAAVNCVLGCEAVVAAGVAVEPKLNAGVAVVDDCVDVDCGCDGALAPNKNDVDGAVLDALVAGAVVLVPPKLKDGAAALVDCVDCVDCVLLPPKLNAGCDDALVLDVPNVKPPVPVDDPVDAPTTHKHMYNIKTKLLVTNIVINTVCIIPYIMLTNQMKNLVQVNYYYQIEKPSLCYMYITTML